jgi:hypothetical protein
MHPKSLSAKSKASVALSGYFDLLKWDVGRKRPGRKRHNPFRGANVFGFHNRMDHSGHARSSKNGTRDWRSSGAPPQDISGLFTGSGLHERRTISCDSRRLGGNGASTGQALKILDYFLATDLFF